MRELDRFHDAGRPADRLLSSELLGVLATLTRGHASSTGSDFT